jgi:asparagine synthase (glutamine-hydrolysing)
MPTRRLANPIFGIFARTRQGLDQLTPDQLESWARRWVAAAAASAWWIDREAGIALLRPEVTVKDGVTGCEAAFCVRGAVFTSLRNDRPGAWPGVPQASGTSSLLYDLLDRGTDALRDLRGQFTFACWDGRQRRLLLGRDHLGQRALYVLTTPHLYVFCSELAPLLRSPATCELDPEGAFWYLAFGMPPPGRTLARHVDRVPAAHVVVLRPREPIQMERYWTPLSPEAPLHATDAVVEEIRAKLDEAIAAYLSEQADVGILLSGGIDSTYLAATASALGTSIHAFTVAFAGQDDLNENEYAEAVAQWLGIKHEIVALNPRHSLSLLQDVVLSAAEPCGAWAALSHFQLLARAAQAGVRFLLSGLGSDEIFGGYDHFRGYYARMLRYLASHSLPQGSNPLRLLLAYENQAARRVLYPGVARCFRDVSLRRALDARFRNFHYAGHLRAFYNECLHIKPEAHAMELMVAHECQHRIPDELFATFEPITRRFGMETSYPFLHPDLIRLATGLSAESRYRTRSGNFSLRLRDLHPRFKHAMLQLARGRVPEVIRTRPRKSFTFPFGAWFCQKEFSRPLLSRLRKSRFWDTGIVRKQWLDGIVRRVAPGSSPAVFELWAVLTLVGWFDHFVDSPRNP